MPLIVQELISRIRVGGAQAGLTVEAVEAAIRAALVACAEDEARAARLEDEAHPWRKPS